LLAVIYPLDISGVEVFWLVLEAGLDLLGALARLGVEGVVAGSYLVALSTVGGYQGGVEEHPATGTH
jgi:hypothetical protein